MRPFLLALQAVCLLAVAFGAAWIYWPAGVIVAGLFGAAVLERRT